MPRMTRRGILGRALAIAVAGFPLGVFLGWLIWG
jgi:hypothetical protein